MNAVLLMTLFIGTSFSLPIDPDNQPEPAIRKRETRPNGDLSSAGTVGGLGIYQSPFGYGGYGGYNGLGGYGGLGGGAGGGGGGGNGGFGLGGVGSGYGFGSGYGGIGGGYGGLGYGGYGGYSGYSGLGGLYGGYGGGLGGLGGYQQFGGLGGAGLGGFVLPGNPSVIPKHLIIPFYSGVGHSSLLKKLNSFTENAFDRFGTLLVSRIPDFLNRFEED